jgi:hypothetical protein
MGVARNTARVDAPPEGIVALWAQPARWPSFVEGFARVVEQDERWPEVGSRIVWESIPEGRGRVTEQVGEHGAERFSVDVREDDLEGVQTLLVEDDGEGGALVRLELEYRLLKPGPLGALTDVLFIRRALVAALGRTLDRFAVEAALAAAER